MKKRNTAIRALSVFLAYAMVCTSVPAAGQEMFGSGVNRETEENTSENRSSRMEKQRKKIQMEFDISKVVR